MAVIEISVCCKSKMMEQLIKIDNSEFGNLYQWVLTCNECGKVCSHGLIEKK